ncbi:NB-ARC domain-containing protein [Pseudorhodoferax sp.]|uniref:NB-ARC domain-containing protein n=1 Tax=Pseudorhodoferax sp. TaxID=1993553 RepID=UPI0039E71A84
MTARDLVFFSYRHDTEGERWLGLILRWLEPYALGRALAAWSDRDIRTGDKWDSQIQGAIDRTQVAVLLVNHNFFGSPYICGRELPRLVAAAHSGELTLVPVPIGPCDERLIQHHGLGAFQFTHSPAAPLSRTVDAQREDSLTEVAIKIYDALGAPPLAAAAPATARRVAEPLALAGLAAEAMRGVLYDVPPLDQRNLVARAEDLATLRARLLHGDAVAQGLTSAAAGVGLHGMGGMGKSVLAQMLCHDDAVRQAFPDGIAWVTLGQQPDLLAAQNQLLRRLQPGAAPADQVPVAQQALKAALAQRRVLLVIDDIWDARHFGAFDVVGPQGRLLLTTRDAAVLVHVGAQAHALQRLPDAAARTLLARWTGQPVASLPPAADTVIEQTGGLPLALALAGAQVANGVSWTTLAQQLERGRLRFLDHHPYGRVYESMGRSVDSLPAAERDRYLELAVFPEEVAVPAATVHRLWAMAGLEPAESERLLGRLARRALLTLQGEGAAQRVALHDLQQDFVLARCEDLSALHGRLLDAHRRAWALPAGPAGWARMPPDEPYLWQQLAAHLVAAGRRSELEAAWLDLDYLQARLASATRGMPPLADVAALVAEGALAARDSAAQHVARTLQRSSHVLAAQPEQLALQLFGRLGRSEAPALQALARQGLLAEAASGLFPSLPALQPPGATLAVLVGDANGALALPDGRALSWSYDGTLRLWDLQRPGEHHTLAGHAGWVRGALLLPDGRALSWSDDRTLRLWDLQRPGEHHTLAGHADGVRGALLLPDGRALSWSDDRTLRLWDLQRPGEHHTLAGHAGRVRGALLLPDGRALSWSHDRTLRLWDLQRPGEHHTLAGHADGVRGALLLPDGRALSWSHDRTLRLWNLQRPGEHQILTGHAGRVDGALLLPDGRALSWSNDRTLRLWDLQRPGEHHTLAGHEDGVGGALLLPDGRALSWSHDRTLRLWDLQRPGEHHTLAGHAGLVFGALLLPDGRALSWSHDRTLRLWDLQRPGEHHTLAGHAGGVDGALLLPDGRALSWSYDGTLRPWDLQRPGEHHTLAGHAGLVFDALLLPDGRALSWSYDGTLRLWDLQRPGEHHTLAGHEDWVNGALLPDGRALSWSDDRTLRLWNLQRPGEHHTLAGHAGRVRGALLLPDGRALSWSDDRTLRLWDLQRPGEHHTLAGHAGWVRGALLLPDGRALSWSDDRTLRLWNLQRPGEHQILTGHAGRVDGALLLPDGRALSWSNDRTLRLWDLQRPGEHHTLAGHEDGVGGALLLPDGRALSWSDDRTLRLWDLQRPGEHHTLAGHAGLVFGALLLPDGRALSWSHDRTLRLWDLQRPGEHHTLAGHEDGVDGALLLPDGRALSWSDDRTLRLWDLRSCTELSSYWADAAPTAVIIDATARLAFVGDALGFVQILRIQPPGS